MPDFVCYTSNLPALTDEAKAVGLGRKWVREDDYGDLRLYGDATPLREVGTEYISLLRVSDVALLGSMSNVQVLGQYEGEDFIPVSPQAQAIYDRMYPRTPIQKSNIFGDYEIVPPARIGEFA